MELSPQPPLSPSFILLSPLKFINEIYSGMASILTTWEWTASGSSNPPELLHGPILSPQTSQIKFSLIFGGGSNWLVCTIHYILCRNVIKSLIYNMRMDCTVLYYTLLLLHFVESSGIFQCSSRPITLCKKFCNTSMFDLW